MIARDRDGQLLACDVETAEAFEAAEALAEAFAREFPPLHVRDEGSWDDRPCPEWQIGWKLAQRIQGIAGALDIGAEEFTDVVAGFWRQMVSEKRCYAAQQIEDDDEEGLVGFVEDKVIEFIDAWGKVREPGGQGALVAAYREAEAHPITLLPPIPQALGWKFTQVMSTAFHLQRFQGSEPILLPIKALAQLLGCHHTTLSAITSLGVRYKLLLPVDPNYSYERHQAKRYRFNLTSPHYRPPAEGRP